MSENIRINKLLSMCGACSRREADRLTEQGRVTVDGKVVSVGEQVSADATIRIDGKEIARVEQKVTLLFHKPRGIVCSTKKQRTETTVAEFLHYPLRIYPVGRLDKESEGLLLLTNEGELVNQILRARNYHEKEYLVTVDQPLTDKFLKGMESGVPILGQVTRPCKIRKTGEKSFDIILTQGLNRQIRRMCEYFGYNVLSLKRIRIMNLKLDGLAAGEYREISKQERAELNQILLKQKKTAGGQYGRRPAGNKKSG